MPPALIYVRPASVDVDVRYVNVGPRVINPPVAIPAMIDDMMLTPVKIHAQPAPDYQAKSKGDERRITNGRAFNIYNRRFILRDIYILRLGRNDLNVVSLDTNSLLIVTHQIPETLRSPPETLDRHCHVVRLVKKGVPQAGSPIHIISHHIKNAWVVGNCPDVLIPILLINT